MTAAELRDLLERVEAHGGPIRLEAGWVFAPDGVVFSYEGLDKPRFHDWLIGVLKRDLITRGCEYEVVYADEIPGNHVCRIYTPSDGTWAIHIGHSDDSELEAVLKAYLAAAEAEGWSA